MAQRVLDLHAGQAVESVARSAAIAAERDAIAHENHLRGDVITGLETEREALIRQAHDHAALKAEHDRLLAEARLRADALAALEQAHEAAVQQFREYRAGSAWSFLTLSQAAAEALRAEHDGAVADARVHADQVSRLEAERDAAVAALQEIHASLGWRIVGFSRRVAARLFPIGTRRRSAFASVLGTISRRRPSSGSKATVGDRGAG
jgi:hypothetical protein